MKIKLQRSNSTQYFYYQEKYGLPELTAFGEHTWGTGEKFVKDAKTGQILKRTREVKYLGRSSNGYHFYLGPKSKLLEKDKPIPSFTA